jgi:hypothetical protein
MSGRERSRREFLLQSLTGAGAVWATVNYGGIAEAAAFAQQSARTASPPGFAFFTAAQAADVDAMAAQIIPTDSTPGARDAHVVVFIDRILSTFEKEAGPEYAKGLAELAAETRRRHPSAASFAALLPADQIAVLTAIEKTPFFNLVRTHTVTGFFAAPVHGGNAGKVGWQLLRYDDALNHRPPFGYYDALPDSTSR